MRSIAEKEISRAHYRLEMGTIPLLDEANPMDSARARASNDIMIAAQNDLHLIVEEDDVPCTHTKAIDDRMKDWSTYFPAMQRFSPSGLELGPNTCLVNTSPLVQIILREPTLILSLPSVKYHFEWKCEGAEREFSDMMSSHPKREDPSKTKERREAGNIISEKRRIEVLGGEEKAKELDSKGDDVRGGLIGMCPIGYVPSPRCECLVWGATEIGNKAYNKALGSFDDDFPVAQAWGHAMTASICEARDKALEDIDNFASRRTPKYCSDIWILQQSRAGEDDPKDHFPPWQQALVMGSVRRAVDKVNQLIRANKGAPGEVAKAEQKKAEDEYRQYSQKRYAEWQERNSESTKTATGTTSERKDEEKEQESENSRAGTETTMELKDAEKGLKDTEKSVQDLEIA